MVFARVTSLVVLAVLSLLACGAEPRATGPTRDPAEADPPLSCTRDEDCGQLVCGPCSSGTVIRASVQSTTCVVNPCPGARGTCNPSHVCVVR